MGRGGGGGVPVGRGQAEGGAAGAELYAPPARRGGDERVGTEELVELRRREAPANSDRTGSADRTDSADSGRTPTNA